MILDNQITVKNYKCFDSNGGGFEKIYPINIIVGKNNSGKSSLIELIQFVIQKNKEFQTGSREGVLPVVTMTQILTETNVKAGFRPNYHDPSLPSRYNDYEYGSIFKDCVYTYKFNQNRDYKFISINKPYVPAALKKIEDIAKSVTPPFQESIFRNITAEREIVSEADDHKVQLSSNGTGATNLIQHILNRTERDSRIIEFELLKEINYIVNPDIKFTRILVQLNQDSKWEIFLEDTHDKRVALSKMGSGIKTIILVLLNLIVIPKWENKEKSNYVFAFEELENNLHPSLQRRLYDYIKKYSEKYKAYFFLTTHSNVIIDSFGNYGCSQLIHVVNDGEKSTCTTIQTYHQTNQLIQDLGIKASDILQSNGVIWVEGPSDRNYLNKWIEIMDPELNEGLHYSIMFYGGKCLANLSFDFDWFNKEVIPLLKINKNAFVVLDRDGKSSNAKLNTTKTRINSEIGEGNYWVTKGREVENYLSNDIVTNWLKGKDYTSFKFTNDPDKKLEDNIAESNTKIKLEYNLSKTLFSSEIKNYITEDSINTLDLKANLLKLIAKIKLWNS